MNIKINSMVYLICILLGAIFITAYTVSKYRGREGTKRSLKNKIFHDERYLQSIEKVKKEGFAYRIVDVKGKGFKVQILTGGEYEDLIIPYFHSYPSASKHYVDKRNNLYSQSEHRLRLYLEAFKQVISDEFPIVRVGRHIMCPYVYVWKCSGSGQTSWDVCYVDPNSYYSRGEGYHVSRGYEIEWTHQKAERHLRYYLDKEAEIEAEENRPEIIIINK